MIFIVHPQILYIFLVQAFCVSSLYVWRRAIVVRQCARNICLSLSLSLYVFVYLCMSGKEQLWRRDNLVGIFVQTSLNWSLWAEAA